MHKAERVYLTTAQVRHLIEDSRDDRLWPLSGFEPLNRGFADPYPPVR